MSNTLPRDELKLLFETGDTPTGDDFATLIESVHGDVSDVKTVQTKLYVNDETSNTTSKDLETDYCIININRIRLGRSLYNYWLGAGELVLDGQQISFDSVADKEKLAGLNLSVSFGKWENGSHIAGTTPMLATPDDFPELASYQGEPLQAMCYLSSIVRFFDTATLETEHFDTNNEASQMSELILLEFDDTGIKFTPLFSFSLHNIGYTGTSTLDSVAVSTFTRISASANQMLILGDATP